MDLYRSYVNVCKLVGIHTYDITEYRNQISNENALYHTLPNDSINPGKVIAFMLNHSTGSGYKSMAIRRAVSRTDLIIVITNENNHKSINEKLKSQSADALVCIYNHFVIPNNKYSPTISIELDYVKNENLNLPVDYKFMEININDSCISRYNIANTDRIKVGDIIRSENRHNNLVRYLTVIDNGNPF